MTADEGFTRQHRWLGRIAAWAVFFSLAIVFRRPGRYQKKPDDTAPWSGICGRTILRRRSPANLESPAHPI